MKLLQIIAAFSTSDCGVWLQSLHAVLAETARPEASPGAAALQPAALACITAALVAPAPPHAVAATARLLAPAGPHSVAAAACAAAATTAAAADVGTGATAMATAPRDNNSTTASQAARCAVTSYEDFSGYPPHQTDGSLRGGTPVKEAPRSAPHASISLPWRRSGGSEAVISAAAASNLPRDLLGLLLHLATGGTSARRSKTDLSTARCAMACLLHSTCIRLTSSKSLLSGPVT